MEGIAEPPKLDLPSPKKHGWKNVLAWVLVSLILGAIGSGVWELIFAPGVSFLGRFITDSWSAASDAVYTTAALDPRPIPDLVTLYLLAMVPGLFALRLFMLEYLRPVLFRKWDRELIAELKKHDPLLRGRARRAFLRRGRKRIRSESLAFIAYLAMVFVAAFVSTTIVNQSAIVWRTFQKNIEICAPFLTDENEEQLRATFRQMRNRGDHLALKQALDRAASDHGIRLEW